MAVVIGGAWLVYGEGTVGVPGIVCVSVSPPLSGEDSVLSPNRRLCCRFTSYSGQIATAAGVRRSRRRRTRSCVASGSGHLSTRTRARRKTLSANTSTAPHSRTKWTPRSLPSRPVRFFIFYCACVCWGRGGGGPWLAFCDWCNVVRFCLAGCFWTGFQRSLDTPLFFVTPFPSLDNTLSL